MKNYIEILKALGDETRLRILHLLIKPGTELCVCELTDSLEVPQYNISRHLKILKQAGLVEERKEGRWVYFRIARNKDRFLTGIIRSVSTLPRSFFFKDEGELQKRFAMRTHGKCLLGVQKRRLVGKGPARR